MTAKELHEQKIIPARMELRKLEEEYKQLYREECAERNGGKRATCDNCAYSCVLEISDHNECMGGKCTCCHGWCYSWMPENEVSAFLRANYPYNSTLYHDLKLLFGDDFLKEASTELVKEALILIQKVRGRFG